jgi:hypothetical protein
MNPYYFDPMGRHDLHPDRSASGVGWEFVARVIRGAGGLLPQRQRIAAREVEPAPALEAGTPVSGA